MPNLSNTVSAVINLLLTYNINFNLQFKFLLEILGMRKLER